MPATQATAQRKTSLLLSNHAAPTTKDLPILTLATNDAACRISHASLLQAQQGTRACDKIFGAQGRSCQVHTQVEMQPLPSCTATLSWRRPSAMSAVAAVCAAPRLALAGRPGALQHSHAVLAPPQRGERGGRACAKPLP